MSTSLAHSIVSAAIGLFIGILSHFALYRMGLPIQPFIYQAF
jgi:ABC-type uncharacterized transport system permease subunit